MQRLYRVAALFALVAGLTAWLAPMGAEEKKKEPTIKDIMTKANKGDDCLLVEIGKDLKEDDPAWKEVLKHSKELSTLSAVMIKLDPPRGSKESWEKLTKLYLTNAKDLVVAAEKKDKTDAAAAHLKLANSCKGCHIAHKPPKK